MAQSLRVVGFQLFPQLLLSHRVRSSYQVYPRAIVRETCPRREFETRRYSFDASHAVPGKLFRLGVLYRCLIALEWIPVCGRPQGDRDANPQIFLAHHVLIPETT